MNITVTYIHHSGFLIETEHTLLLFDYFAGALPPLAPEKKLFVFSSHSHGDHFSPVIYSLPHPAARYILSQDIKYKGYPKELTEQICFTKKHSTLTIEGVTVNTLRSTDKGVAFWVETDGISLYHAGDLNHWHWEGEPEQWNREMGEKYRRELERIHGKSFDLAFIPLDPRLNSAQELGVREFLQYAEARHIFPMHMWGDFSACSGLKQDIPQLMQIQNDGQVFALEF